MRIAGDSPEGLVPWAEVAAAVKRIHGLDFSAGQIRKLGDIAMAKIARRMIESGVCESREVKGSLRGLMQKKATRRQYAGYRVAG